MLKANSKWNLILPMTVISALGVEEKNIQSAREYMERLEGLSAGNPAPDFEIVDVEGKIARLKDSECQSILPFFGDEGASRRAPVKT